MTITALQNSEEQFSGNNAQKDRREHCKTPRWRCWFDGSQPPRWWWKFDGFTALFLGPPGEPVPEENFWTLWCKGRLTEADTPTIRLGATPSRLTSVHLHQPPPFFTGQMPFLLPNQQCQSTEGKSCRYMYSELINIKWYSNTKLLIRIMPEYSSDSTGVV